MGGMEWISKHRKTFRKLLLWMAGFLLLVAVAGFLVAPPLVKSVVERRLKELLNREARVASVRVNPFALSLTFRGVEVKDLDGSSPFAGFDSLHVRFSAPYSLFTWTPVIASADLLGPKVTVVRNVDGSYNFSDLLKKEPSKKLLHYSVNNIRVSGGRVDFDDRPMGAKHQMTDIEVGIPFLSNVPSKVEIDTEPSFSCTFDGRPLEVRGKARPFSERLQMAVEMRVEGLDLPRYLAYLPVDLGVKVSAGALDVRGNLTFREGRKAEERALVVAGHFALRGLAVEEKGGGTLSRLPLAEADVTSADLLRKRVTLGRVLFQNPEVNLARGARGSLNIAPLLPAPSTEKKASPDAGFRLTAAGITVRGGTLSLSDEAVRPPVRMVLKPLEVEVTSFDSGMAAPMGLKVQFTTDSGATFKNQGVVTPNPLAAEGALEAVGFKLGPLAPYLDPQLPVQVGGGTLDGSAKYAVRSEAGSLSGTVTEISASLTDLSARLPEGKDPFLKVGSVDLKESSVDLGARTVQVGDLSVDRARVSLTRSKEGAIDVAEALAPKAADGESARTRPSAWQVGVTHLTLDRSAVEVEDQGPSRPAHLLLSLRHAAGEDLSTKPGTKGRVSLRASLNEAGTLEAQGPLGLAPLSLDWAVKAKDLPVMPLEPYLSDFLEIQMTAGAASGSGRFSLKVPDSGNPQGSFEGDVEVNDLATVDKAQMQDFLNWKSLRLGVVSAHSSPPAVSIQEVALTDFYSRLIVSPDGKLNLAQIVSARGPAPQEAAPSEPWDQPTLEEETAPSVPSAATPAAPPADVAQGEPPQAFALTFENVTLAGGNIHYTDLFIKPNYNANMTEVTGRISGLSSDPATRADMELRAKLDHQAPIEVAGKLNPLSKDLFLDIQGKVTDVELSPMSPYSGKFAGYIIEKGKLNMEVTYRVESGRLEADNHIFLDQFTLGDKVDSPSATKLPVKLAVALLKDSQGRIDLTLPVSGSLQDPRFKIGRVILKIIVNLIAKAITSPFALLGRMFGGGGETLSFIEFEPGRATLDPAAQAKVDKLRKALADRPGLRLDISGRSDTATDTEGLKKVQVERSVKAEKLREMAKEDAESPSLDSVVVGAEEYPKLLFKAYKHMKFPKPRTLVGTAKELPVPEMEGLMLVNVVVTDDDLRQLAQTRAQAVKDALCAPGGADATRVFLAAEVKPSTEAAKAKPSRVDLSLQ